MELMRAVILFQRLCSGAGFQARKVCIILSFCVVQVTTLSCSSRLVSVQEFDSASMPNKTDTMGSPDTSRHSENTFPYALVAGGSKGIGYALAEALARRKYNLILIARHMDGLQKAKDKLESAYDVRVEILKLDLAFEESADSIAAWCMEKNIPLKILCNVAGFGGMKDYLSLPLDSLRYMVRLNVESCMALSLTLLPVLERNAPAYILNVASMAGFVPIPEKNMYAATKSFVVFFSWSLRYQLKTRNISVSCLSPGPVFTKPEIRKTTGDKLGWLGMQMAVGPQKVGEIAIRKTLKKKPMIVPGTLAGIMSAALRTLPVRWAVALSGKAGE
jgi:uncharacterized protein